MSIDLMQYSKTIAIVSIVPNCYISKNLTIQIIEAIEDCYIFTSIPISSCKLTLPAQIWKAVQQQKYLFKRIFSNYKMTIEMPPSPTQDWGSTSAEPASTH
jgi:hypothetical protein